jgi:GMP synthase-like glutamine amidotransferase
MINYFHSLNEEEPSQWVRNLSVSVAILDMNNGWRNVGIRNIRRLIEHFQFQIRSSHPQVEIKVDQYHVRDRSEIPDLSYDIYVSSGGPGNPLDDSGSDWENRFFRLLDDVWQHNATNEQKKFFFGICHSFQVMVKRFGVGIISRRERRNLGIVPVFKTQAGTHDPIFDGLHPKFYVFDNRDYQVTDPDHRKLDALGASVLSYECENNRLGEAITGIRYTPEIESVQFHPEAEKNGILIRFTDPEERQKMIELIGEEKFDEFMQSVHNPNKLLRTYRTVLPGFLTRSFNRLMMYYDRPPLDTGEGFKN